MPNGPGTVGGLSWQGNEGGGGNKIFRHFRKHLSRKGDVMRGLMDVLWLHWLYSNPLLASLDRSQHKKHKCSVCHQEGHNKRTCTFQKICKINSSTNKLYDTYSDIINTN